MNKIVEAKGEDLHMKDGYRYEFVYISGRGSNIYYTRETIVVSDYYSLDWDKSFDEVIQLHLLANPRCHSVDISVYNLDVPDKLAFGISCAVKPFAPILSYWRREPVGKIAYGTQKGYVEIRVNFSDLVMMPRRIYVFEINNDEGTYSDKLQYKVTSGASEYVRVHFGEIINPLLVNGDEITSIVVYTYDHETMKLLDKVFVEIQRPAPELFFKKRAHAGAYSWARSIRQ